MKLTFMPGSGAGTVAAPPSKSMAHRLLIGAALAGGESRITGMALCEDTQATADCLRALGAGVAVNGDTAVVRGCGGHLSAPAAPLPCRSSGSTLRLLVPLALTGERAARFTGSKALFRRPLAVYRALCRAQGCTFAEEPCAVTVKGPLRAGDFALPGGISSQFISGMLFALPLLKGNSNLRILPPAESVPYIDLTVQALSLFGIRIERSAPDFFWVPGNQHYMPVHTAVEGDHSNAAFLEALNLFGGRVTVTGTDRQSLQGDKIYRTHFESLCRGAPVISLRDCPDLAPLLFAAAAARHGGIFTDTGRLRFKESDRAAVMAEELSKFGAALTVSANTVTVCPAPLYAPRVPLCAHGDHRVAMALAVLCTVTGGTLEGAEAVTKSFPDFYEKLRELGIRFVVED